MGRLRRCALLLTAFAAAWGTWGLAAEAVKAPPKPAEALGDLAPGTSKDPTFRDADLVLDYSAGWVGQLDSCGCAGGDKGGIARRATFLQQQVASNANQVPLFAGDCPSAASKDTPLTAATAYEAMSRMGYQAVALGETDFRFGLAFLREQISRYPGLFVCANVVDSATGKPLAEPYVVRIYPAVRAGARKELRIAVLSLMDPALNRDLGKLLGAEAPKVKVLDAAATAKDLVPRLKQEADLLVVMYHSAISGAVALAQSVPGIDFLIAGHAPGVFQRKTAVGATVIAASSDQGKEEAQAGVTLTPGGAPIIKVETVPLNETFADNLAIAALVAEYKKKAGLPPGKPSAETAAGAQPVSPL
ncbi:MAG TPA: hypothetical protein VGN26_18560 [Armatimonadota bacterium]|jgi:2',3'-cyclic-nucleotide 2'-phosphodiesterase (5'-nucleotidase family)